MSNSSVLPRPRAILFDWDNTLVDTWPLIHAALHHTFTHFGLEPWSFEVTRQRVGKSMRDAFPALFGKNSDEATTLYQQHYRANHLQKLSALPGAEAIARFPHEQGLYCAVVSNKRGENLRTEIEHLGWSAYFDRAIGADDAARDKPDPAPVIMALQGSFIEPGREVWFVGDSEVDLQCAENTGCIPVLYGELAMAHPEFSATHFQGFPYRAYVKGHEEMATLLRAALEE